MKTIVVLDNNRSKEDRSWMCNHKGEAENMVKWLSENRIKASAFTTSEWNKLKE